MSKKRVNKRKPDIVSDIQLVQDADRRRALVSDILFPYLKSMKDTVGYSKVFLQAFSGLVEGVFDERRKTVTLGQMEDDLISRLKKTFDIKDSIQKIEFARYSGLVEILKDISVQDLAYATELSRFIDGYIVKKHNNDLIESIPIAEILG